MNTHDPHVGGIPVDDPPQARTEPVLVGPAALESAAWWAAQADEAARRAMHYEGAVPEEAQCLRAASAFAAVAQAHAAVAHAALAAETHSMGIPGEAWEAVLRS